VGVWEDARMNLRAIVPDRQRRVALQTRVRGGGVQPLQGARGAGATALGGAAGSALAQRLIGNRALGHLLREAAAPVQTTADLDRQYNKHLNESPPAWDDAARDLNGFGDEDIKVRVGQLRPEQLDPVKEANERVNGAATARIRAPILERQWGESVRAHHWFQAAVYLNGFNDDDVKRLLTAMDPDDLMHLDMEAPLAWFPRIAALAEPIKTADEPRRIADLNRRYQWALAHSEWLEAITLLNAFDEADLERLTGELNPVQLAALQLMSITAPVGAAVRQWLSFRAQGSLAGAHPAQASGVVPGGESAPVPVEGGQVVTSTEATSGEEGGWFGQTYTGPDAQNMGWLQFLAREVEKFDAGGKSLGFDTSVVTEASGQDEKRHWGSPASPYWTVDTFGDALPFYDSPTTKKHGSTPAGASGASDVGPERQAMFDHPGARNDVAQKEFDTHFWETDVAKVVIRYHFVDYLVHGRKVVYKNSVEVEWTYESAAAAEAAGEPPRTNTAGVGGAAAKLSADHYAALLRRFPTATYFPHD
jgi:hypothetical protein